MTNDKQANQKNQATNTQLTIVSAIKTEVKATTSNKKSPEK